MSGEDRDLLSQATEAVEQLYHVRDTYFPSDPQHKISTLRNDADLALNLLDSIPAGNNLSPFHLLSPTQQHLKSVYRGRVWMHDRFGLW